MAESDDEQLNFRFIAVGAWAGKTEEEIKAEIAQVQAAEQDENQ
jgi:hypothetical protein